MAKSGSKETMSMALNMNNAPYYDRYINERLTDKDDHRDYNVICAC
jgi:hypothetical protein